ncbi:MAG TPA: transposase [Phycisphaerae bacterium]|nr:transposase [Phycisphaerae bacterium]
MLRSSRPATPAFPGHRSGRLPHWVFRGLLGVHCTLRPARSPGRHATFYTGGFRCFVASTTAPIATGWSDSCQAGLPPAEDRRLFLTAHLSLHRTAPSSATPCQLTGALRGLEPLAGALWTFADVPGVEPTNNAAERAIRPAVWWRQASFGTQSERGNRFVESLLTVTATCRLQARNVLDYLVQAIEAHLSGLPSPSLIPTSSAWH